jgi:hypothetical protein
MTWLLLGGGPTPALEPDARAATSHSTTSNGFQLDETDAAELGPRLRPVSPSIDHSRQRPPWRASAHAAHEPKVAFVDECAAQQRDAKASRTMPESSCHALPRIMDECTVESLEDYDGHVADALPKNMETANIAPEAPVLDSAAADGAIIALEASLASESAGGFYISLCVLHTRRTQDQ